MWPVSTIFGILFFIRKHCHSEYSLYHPPAPVYTDFYYSRSISIDIGVSLMPHGPWVEVFQTNIQLFRLIMVNLQLDVMKLMTEY